MKLDFGGRLWQLLQIEQDTNQHTPLKQFSQVWDSWMLNRMPNCSMCIENLELERCSPFSVVPLTFDNLFSSLSLNIGPPIAFDEA